MNEQVVRWLLLEDGPVIDDAREWNRREPNGMEWKGLNWTEMKWNKGKRNGSVVERNWLALRLSLHNHRCEVQDKIEEGICVSAIN